MPAIQYSQINNLHMCILNNVYIMYKAIQSECIFCHLHTGVHMYNRIALNVYTKLDKSAIIEILRVKL